ncbi:MAG: NUDIX domain-containing protein [bacterium]
MELLKEIKDKESPQDESLLEIREAARAVLFDEDGLVPLLFVAKYNYYKIPGGGIDKGEDKLQALAREVLEEAGSEIKVTGEVGKIIEFRSKWNFKQVSYCYLGQVISKGKPNFTGKELSQGFKLVWMFLGDCRQMSSRVILSDGGAKNHEFFGLNTGIPFGYAQGRLFTRLGSFRMTLWGVRRQSH